MSKCIKEKCKFYDYLSECAIDCCLFGASAEDNEKERGCYKNRCKLGAPEHPEGQ